MRALLLAALAVGALALPARAQEAPCEGGAAADADGTAYPCSGVALLARLPVSSFETEGSPAAGGNNDVWGWTDPATGTEYALVGTTNGTGFVDLSDPARPRLVGKLPAGDAPSPWRDVKVYADHAFVVADRSPEHGVQVFDLRRLRDVEGPPVTFAPDAVYDRVGSAHNIVVNEETGFAYAVGSRPRGEGLPAECGARGLHAIDVRDPQRPTFAGCFSNAAADPTFVINAGYTHDAQCVVYRGPDADYAGRELCFAANEDEVTVFDVTDKAAVRIVSQTEYPGDAYTHQGWLTEDHRFFLVNDELDEVNAVAATQRTVVLDLADLDEPGEVSVYDSGLTTIDHNLYVHGGLVYESNYEAGLRVLDARGLAEGRPLAEVAYFDTFPASTTISAPCLPPNEGSDCESFNGQWSNYPFFASGIVVANDRDNGLFVLRPDAALATSAPAPPAAFSLSDPSPNPTPGTARLTLRVPTAQAVRADLYDLAGRRVRPVFDGRAEPGRDLVLEVQGAALPAGVYVVRVVGEAFEASRRVTLAR